MITTCPPRIACSSCIMSAGHASCIYKWSTAQECYHPVWLSRLVKNCMQAINCHRIKVFLVHGYQTTRRNPTGEVDLRDEDKCEVWPTPTRAAEVACRTRVQASCGPSGTPLRHFRLFKILTEQLCRILSADWYCRRLGQLVAGDPVVLHHLPQPTAISLLLSGEKCQWQPSCVCAK